ncbi:MAG: amidohydrolase family protein [Phycisphaeraceae bacterium]|nr:amidohydrolase family protein [Phycisphaeraceae bacterium]
MLAGDPPFVVRIDAGAAMDAGSVELAPASILLNITAMEWAQVLRLEASVLAIDAPGEIDGHPAAPFSRRVDLRDSLLLPGLVNAHTHLDLTHIGPLAHDPSEGFVAWVDRIRVARLHEPDEIAESVRRGIDLCLAGGTVAIGDIAGAPAGVPSLTPLSVLRDSPLAGVSFLEFFAIGKGERPGLARIQEAVKALKPGTGHVRPGLQPHAPNTVSRLAYGEAAALAQRHGLPLCTHLAESPEEREFIAAGAGPQRSLLERVGVWDESVAADVGRGCTPTGHLAPILAEAELLAVHLNDVSDGDIDVLRRTGTRAVYCPRASEYFGTARAFGPHRYRDLLAAGVPVALGTDSIVNLPGQAADPRRGGISVLDEMRALWRRDAVEARVLLEMVTDHGATALSMDVGRFRLASGSRPAGMVAIGGLEELRDASSMLRSALAGNSAPLLLFCGK